jgi:hypothetical protein
MSSGLGSSLYSLGADPTQNTASSNPSVVFMCGCVAMKWIFFGRNVFTGRYQATRVPFRDRCIATVWHVTISWITFVWKCMVQENIFPQRKEKIEKECEYIERWTREGRNDNLIQRFNVPGLQISKLIECMWVFPWLKSYTCEFKTKYRCRATKWIINVSFN